MLRTINFMGVRNFAFGVTVFLTLLAMFSVVTKGMNWGLDFTGGTLIELTYERPADVTKVREQLVTSGYHEAIVQSFGATTDLLVRMPGEDPQLGHQVAEALLKVGGDNPAMVKRVEFVGPQVGGGTKALYHGFVIAGLDQLAAHQGNVGRLLIGQLDERTAGEVQAVVQALMEPAEQRQNGKEHGDAERNISNAHEVDCT